MHSPRVVPQHGMRSRIRWLVRLSVRAAAIALVAVLGATAVQPTPAEAAEPVTVPVMILLPDGVWVGTAPAPADGPVAELANGLWTVQDADLQRTLEFADPGNQLPEVDPEAAQTQLRDAVLSATGGIDLNLASDRTDLDQDLDRALDIFLEYNRFNLERGGSGGTSEDLSTVEGQAERSESALELVTQESSECRERCLISPGQAAFRYLLIPVVIGGVTAAAGMILGVSAVPAAMIALTAVVLTSIASFMWGMKDQVDAQARDNRNRDIQQTMGRVMGGLAVAMNELQNQANQAGIQGGVGGAMNQNEQFMQERVQDLENAGDESFRTAASQLSVPDWNEP
jgi:hypothetical protein